MATLKINKMPQILVMEAQKPVKPQFDFQGSQNMHVRVATSCLDVMIQTQFHCRMLGKLIAYNTTISYFIFILNRGVAEFELLISNC